MRIRVGDKIEGCEEEERGAAVFSRKKSEGESVEGMAEKSTEGLLWGSQEQPAASEQFKS